MTRRPVSPPVHPCLEHAKQAGDGDHDAEDDDYLGGRELLLVDHPPGGQHVNERQHAGGDAVKRGLERQSLSRIGDAQHGGKGDVARSQRTDAVVADVEDASVVCPQGGWGRRV